MIRILPPDRYPYNWHYSLFYCDKISELLSSKLIVFYLSPIYASNTYAFSELVMETAFGKMLETFLRKYEAFLGTRDHLLSVLCLF